MESLGDIVEWVVLVLITLGLFAVSRKVPRSSEYSVQRWVIAAVGPAVVLLFVAIRNVEPVSWRIALMLLVLVVLTLLSAHAYRLTKQEDAPS
jgi:cell division protein FtsW (lipid II flippase)